MFSGRFGLDQLETALNSYAAEGWRIAGGLSAMSNWKSAKSEIVIFLERDNNVRSVRLMGCRSPDRHAETRRGTHDEPNQQTGNRPIRTQPDGRPKLGREPAEARSIVVGSDAHNESAVVRRRPCRRCASPTPMRASAALTRNTNGPSASTFHSPYETPGASRESLPGPWTSGVLADVRR